MVRKSSRSRQCSFLQIAKALKEQVAALRVSLSNVRGSSLHAAYELPDLLLASAPAECNTPGRYKPLWT